MFRIILIAVCFSGFIIQGYGQCPEKTGRFPVSGQCDAYLECNDGVAEEKLCPDGLLFNDKLSPMAYPCQYPIDVSCENRGRTQQAQPTEDCPHQFGYYRLGDRADCGRFMNCAAGRSYIFECPEGLAFNKDQYRCDWPDQVEDCDEEAYLKFKCPQIQKSSELGFEEQRTYKSPHDCHHYYVCLEGKPRLLSCGEDRAFNEAISACDELENVQGCVTCGDSLCPQPNGKFGVPGQCDAYIECTDGIHEEKLCPDGLLFNEELSPEGECQYKPSVTCVNRAKLQPPQPTDTCPHQFGFYRIGDSSHCQSYMNCAHGVGSLTKCPEGLAFNEKTYKCDWPDETDDCDSEAYLDFKCPPALIRALDEDGNAIEPEKLRYYRNEKSCKHYFVCVNEKPRLYACAKFLVYNDKKKGCDFRSDITECNKDRSRPNLSQITELQKVDPKLLKTLLI